MNIRLPLGKSGESHHETLFKKIILFIYFWLAGSLLLGGLYSSCERRGCALVAGCGLLTVVAARVAERGSRVHVCFRSCCSQALEHRPNSCGAQAQLSQGTCDLPGPGIEPMFPALAGRFLTSEPPGKPSFQRMCLKWTKVHSDVRRRQLHTPHSGLFQDSTSLNTRGCSRKHLGPRSDKKGGWKCESRREACAQHRGAESTAESTWVYSRLCGLPSGTAQRRARGRKDHRRPSLQPG